MTDCRQVLDHLSEYLDEELPVGACDEIARHLDTCAGCGEARERLLRSIEVCREYRSTERPGELPREAREELRAAYLKVREGMKPR